MNDIRFSEKLLSLANAFADYTAPDIKPLSPEEKKKDHDEKYEKIAILYEELGEALSEK